MLRVGGLYIVPGDRNQHSSPPNVEPPPITFFAWKHDIFGASPRVRSNFASKIYPSSSSPEYQPPPPPPSIFVSAVLWRYVGVVKH